MNQRTVGYPSTSWASCLDMHPHRQVSVYVDAEIADGLHWHGVMWTPSISIPVDGYQLHGVQDEQNWSQHRTLRHTADEVNDG